MANLSTVTKVHQNPTIDSLNKKSSRTLQTSDGETCQSSDGFIGVQRKRGKTRKFFLTGIAESVNQSQIFCHFNQRNIIPKYISIFPSRRRGTLSCKIHIPSGVSALKEKENFWPKFVTCKPWR